MPRSPSLSGVPRYEIGLAEMISTSAKQGIAMGVPGPVAFDPGVAPLSIAICDSVLQQRGCGMLALSFVTPSPYVCARSLSREGTLTNYFTGMYLRRRQGVMALVMVMEGLFNQVPIGRHPEKQAPGAMHYCASIPHPPVSIAFAPVS